MEPRGGGSHARTSLGASNPSAPRAGNWAESFVPPVAQIVSRGRFV
jgi:hypothetical protein